MLKGAATNHDHSTENKNKPRAWMLFTVKIELVFRKLAADVTCVVAPPSSLAKLVLKLNIPENGFDTSIIGYI
jgi:hypothetical protein